MSGTEDVLVSNLQQLGPFAASAGSRHYVERESQLAVAMTCDHPVCCSECVRMPPFVVVRGRAEISASRVTATAARGGNRHVEGSQAGKSEAEVLEALAQSQQHVAAANARVEPRTATRERKGRS